MGKNMLLITNRKRKRTSHDEVPERIFRFVSTCHHRFVDKESSFPLHVLDLSLTSPHLT